MCTHKLKQNYSVHKYASEANMHTDSHSHTFRTSMQAKVTPYFTNVNFDLQQIPNPFSHQTGTRQTTTQLFLLEPTQLFTNDMLKWLNRIFTSGESERLHIFVLSLTLWRTTISALLEWFLCQYCVQGLITKWNRCTEKNKIFPGPSISRCWSKFLLVG